MGARGPKRKTDPRVAIAYLRISKDEPGSHSLDAQRRDIERWAVANRIRVVAWHADNGLSGAVPVDGRPALAAALGDVYERRAGLLVAVAHDRIARDVGVALAVEQELGSIGARSAVVSGLDLEGLTPEVWAALAERDEKRPRGTSRLTLPGVWCPCSTAA